MPGSDDDEPKTIKLPINGKVVAALVAFLAGGGGGAVGFEILGDAKAPPAVMAELADVKENLKEMKGQVELVTGTYLQMQALGNNRDEKIDRLIHRVDKLEDRVHSLETE